MREDGGLGESVMYVTGLVDLRTSWLGKREAV